MKQQFKCPECDAYVDFQINVLQGTLFSKSIKEISIRNGVATVKLSPRVTEELPISVDFRNVDRLFLVQNNVREATAYLTCENGHKHQYKVILE